MNTVMAAALFRGGSGFCLRCVHRELCRVVWRPQTAALFSSKPSDRKQPRRTHIKKAKPQPAVDIPKLLEQLFSQQRPGTAPPTGKARPSKPPTSSKTEPAASVFAPSLKSVPAAPSSATSSTSASASDGTEGRTSAETIETKVETAEKLPSSPVEPVPPPVETLEATAEASVEPTVETKDTDSGVFVSHTAKEELLIETTVETSHFPVETLEAAAAVVEGPVESTIDVTLDATAQKVDTKHGIPLSATVEPSLETTVEASITKESRSAAVEPTVDVEFNSTDLHTAKVEPLIETTVETSPFSVETLETQTVASQAPVEPTIDITLDAVAQKVETNSTDKVEPVIETIEPAVEAVETQETRAAVAEGPVETTIKAEAAHKIENKNTDLGPVKLSHTYKEESLIETTIESQIEASGTLETGAAVAEGSLETTIEADKIETKNSDLGPVKLSHPSIEEFLIETTIESPIEASGTLEIGAAVTQGSVETPIEADKIETKNTDLGPVKLSHTSKEESLIETTIESPIKASGTLETGAAVVEDPVDVTVEATSEKVETISATSGPFYISHTETVEPAVEAVIEPTIEPESSSVNVPVDDVKMTLESMTLHVDSVLVASLQTDELLQTQSVLEQKAEQQLQQMSEVKTAAEGESSSEDEGESLTDVLSKWDSLGEDLLQLEGESGALVTELLIHAPAAATLHKTPKNEAEAMTLESVTLSNVTAEVEGLETEVLQETRNALEKEADVLVKEEKMEAGPTRKDVSEEEEILTLDLISEAADAIEAETAVMMEAMFGSEQGPLQPPGEQKLDPEPGDQEVNVLEAMSLESVTLAEVEASLGALEALSETSEYLEREAEIVAGEETKMEVEVEVEVEVEETSEELKMEALSLPEGDEDLQIDALMEELLCSAPGHVTRGTGGQEVVRAENLDATVAAGSVDVDPATAVTDDPPASVLEEVLQGQEEVEEVEEVEGEQTALDPVQRLFLEKIIEYNNMRRLNGGLMEAEPEYDKKLSEETAKLQRLYGGGDLSSFPQFTFTEPEMDQDSK